MGESASQTAIRSSYIQTVVTIARTGITLVVFSILSRLLSKDDFGYFAIITAITEIFSVVTEAGMGAAIIQTRTFSRGYFNTAFTLALYFGVFFSGLLIALSGPLSRLVSDETIAVPLCWMSISILFFSLNSVTKAEMTRKLQFKRIGIYNIWALVLASTAAIYAAWKGAGVYAVIIQTLLNSVFTFVIFYLALEQKPRWFAVEKRYVKEIFGYGGWLTASVVVRVIYQQMDKILMSIWFPVSVLGSFNRPSGFIGRIADQINGIFDTVLFPILSSIQDDVEKIRRALSKLLYMVNLYSGMLCLLFVVGSKALLTIFFGPEWTSLTLVFIVLSLAVLLMVNGRIMDCFIRSLAYVKAGFYMRIIACGITVGSLFVGKEFGLIGLAAAVVAAQYFIVMMKLFYVCGKVGVSFWEVCKFMLRSIRVVILPLVLSVVFYKYVNYSFLTSLLSTVGVVLYLLFMLLCVKGVMGEDLSAIIYKRLPVLRKFLIVR